MSLLDELSTAISAAACRRLARRRRHRLAAARLGRRHRGRQGPDQRPQPPRRRGHRDLRRRPLGSRARRRHGPGRRPRRHRRRHGGRDGARLGRRCRGPRRASSSGWRRPAAGRPGSRSERCPRSTGRSGVPAGGASPAASSTPPRWRPGSSGGPIVDAAGRLVGLNTHRIGEGFYLARQADADLRERVEILARGQSVERPRLGVEVAPSHVARRLRRSVGPARASRPARPWRRGRLAGGRGRDPRGRPHRPDRGLGCHGRGQPARRDGRGEGGDRGRRRPRRRGADAQRRPRLTEPPAGG